MLEIAGKRFDDDALAFTLGNYPAAAKAAEGLAAKDVDERTKAVTDFLKAVLELTDAELKSVRFQDAAKACLAILKANQPEADSPKAQEPESSREDNGSASVSDSQQGSVAA